MNELTLHPDIYSTGDCKGLIGALERVWLRDHKPGDGTIYIISGFANYNGGVRFYHIFQNHIARGGKVVAFFSGSAGQRITSKQVVSKLLECGVEVHIVNRKRLMHAKSYGSCTGDGQLLIVTSGNFTGPGMAQNVEITLLLDRPTTQDLGFSWNDMVDSMLNQAWDIHRPSLGETDAPAWGLLYDERASDVILSEKDAVTTIISLGHADTVRINAEPGSIEGKGTQYFWLSKDCYDFFPPLTILNKRGNKNTYSCIVNVNFIDINEESQVRVTFEAENNLDFRLGTGPLRNTGTAQSGDLAAISRIGEDKYEIRIIGRSHALYSSLSAYAINYIGHRDKRYGFVSNQKFQEGTGIILGNHPKQ